MIVIIIIIIGKRSNSNCCQHFVTAWKRPSQLCIWQFINFHSAVRIHLAPNSSRTMCVCEVEMMARHWKCQVIYVKWWIKKDVIFMYGDDGDDDVDTCQLFIGSADFCFQFFLLYCYYWADQSLRANAIHEASFVECIDAKRIINYYYLEEKKPIRFVSTKFKWIANVLRERARIHIHTNKHTKTETRFRCGPMFGSNKSQAINSLLNLDRIDYIFADKFKVLTLCNWPCLSR